MMLNRIFTYITAILLITLVACSDDIIPDSRLREGDPDTVTIPINFDITEVQTRADNGKNSYDDNSINKDSVYCFVFDQNHYFISYSKLEVSESATGVSGKLTLRKTADKRYIHFVANHSFDESVISKTLTSEYMGTEADVFTYKEMLVADGYKAYWQRVELPNVDEGTTIGKVKMIRNFAKMTLDLAHIENGDDKIVQNSDGTKDVEWAIVNRPCRGTVAPYISGQDFAPYTDGYDFASISGSYSGYLMKTYTAAPIYDHLEDEITTDNGPDWQSWSEPIYLYENDTELQDATYKQTRLMLKVNLYNEEKTSSQYYYYTVLISDANEYTSIPILRNFNYEVKITGILGEGMDTPQQALQSPAGNNVSGSVITKDLTGISNNTGSLRVDYTSKIIVKGGDVALKYRYNRYETNSSGDMSIVNCNSDVSLTIGDGKVIQSYTLAANDDEDGYRTITFKVDNPSLSVQRQKVTLKVSDDKNKDLYREVWLTLRKRYQYPENAFTLEWYKDNDADYTTNSGTYNVWVKLPKGLPEAIFPLYFSFETLKLDTDTKPATIFPDPNRSVMSVQSEVPSLFDFSNTESYSFRRKVTYDMYKDGGDADSDYTTSDESSIRQDHWKVQYYNWRRISSYTVSTNIGNSSTSAANPWHDTYCSDFSKNNDNTDYVVIGFYFHYGYSLNYSQDSSWQHRTTRFAVYNEYFSVNADKDLSETYGTPIRQSYDIYMYGYNSWLAVPTVTLVESDENNNISSDRLTKCPQ
jgi:hypothetical protein